MIIPRQKSFSDNPEQREFNSKAAKERNYKWLKETSKQPIRGVDAIIDRVGPYQDRKVWKKLNKKEQVKKLTELERIQKDNKRASELSNKTKERVKNAKIGYEKNLNNLMNKAEELDNIADKKEKSWETKEYKKSGEIRKKLRDTSSSGKETAMEKANLRGQKAERDFLERRINKAKRLTERENKLAKIKDSHKFSTKLKKGLKSILSKVK